MAKIYLILNFITIIFAAYGQTEQSVNKFTVKNGLPSPIITCMVQDEDGFMWLGTNNGLSRFDGTEFKNYYHQPNVPSIPANAINYLYTLPLHRLLIATETGLCLFNTADGTYKNLLIKSGNAVFTFENNFTVAVRDGVNNIWAGTTTCLYKLDSNLTILKTYRGLDKTDINTAKLKYVQDIEPVEKGLLLQLQQKISSGFSMLQAAQENIVPLDKIIGNYFKAASQNMVRSLKSDGDKNFFFIKHTVDSLFYFNVQQHRLCSISLANYAPPNRFYYDSKLLFANKKILCCSLSGGGVLLISNPHSAFNLIGDKPVIKIILANETVNAAWYDGQNNLWVGTNSGLYKCKPFISGWQTTAFSLKNLSGEPPENNLIQLATDKIFVTTSSSGIYYKSRTDEKNAWSNVCWANCPKCNTTWNVRAINEDTCWIGTQQGLYWWVNKNNSYGHITWPKQFSQIDSVPVITQFVDSKGLLWMGIGFGVGVAAFNTHTHKLSLYTHTSKNTFLPIRYPHAIAEDNEANIWMGSQDGTGIVKWDRRTEQFIIKAPGYNTLFNNAVIFSMLGDKMGNIWVGTNNGLLQFNTNMQVIKKYDVTNGTSANQIYGLTFDSSNGLWMATANGINYLNLKTGNVIQCAERLGLQDSGLTAVKFDSISNRVYYTTLYSVNSINASAINTQYPASKIVITDVVSEGKAVWHAGQPIRLSYHFNNLSIYYTAADLSNGPLNTYYYKLNDTKEWVALGHQRQINFYSLSSGVYTFHVKSRDVNGQWSANEATIFFIVATPFYKTWWFITATVVTAFAVVYMLYQYRLKQLLHVQLVRNKIATDLHDDIGSTLTNINILAELGYANIHDKAKATDFLKRISAEVNATSGSLDDIVWSINADNDGFDQMAARMRRYAADLFEPAGIQYEIAIDDTLAGKNLPMEQRRDIYLIFKEAMNNIYKHAGAKWAKASLLLYNKKMVMIIQDDGKGFDTTLKTQRNGLKNMQTRAQKWSGTCTITSVPTGTTTVTITMKG